uniref:hypothetical protein n=1 Tax=Ornithinimicrobium cavernae TaxID=2666047 RepID=UPI00192A69E1
LAAADDDPWDTEQQFTSWDQITLTHTPQNGRRTYHPDPHTTRAEHDRHHASTTTDDTDSASSTTDGTDSASSGPDNHDSDGAAADTEHGRGSTAREHDHTDANSDGPTTPWTPDPDAPPPF